MTLRLGLLTRPATVELVTHSGPPDDYGTPSEVVVAQEVLCEFQQRARSERDDGLAEVGSEQWFVCLPPGIPVGHQDRIVVGGITYECDGPPWEVRHPISGQVSHIEVTVKRGA